MRGTGCVTTTVLLLTTGKPRHASTKNHTSGAVTIHSIVVLKTIVPRVTQKVILLCYATSLCTVMEASTVRVVVALCRHATILRATEVTRSAQAQAATHPHPPGGHSSSIASRLEKHSALDRQETLVTSSACLGQYWLGKQSVCAAHAA